MYVVTGASGRLGRLTLRHLVERVDAAKVVALTRTPDKVADPGVRVRAADFGDRESLTRAFDGAERAGYIGYVAREDCAAVGAALLAEGGHTGEYLDVTGPYVAIIEGEGGKGSRRRGGRLDAPTCEGQCAPASSRPS
ncbi:NAD(P)H-binding protein [Streptomyces sp. A1-5]|uniref:NAD(P)H-binding protein n=1 Tax=Streptomyces sp. A1-5 TaxID=2738410 RepID=UPI001F336972|nr:NAD(P)H-binding protein [Streptomyces sp. A1-5]UJB44917.1 NAD(P)H-binding protein [Streptomyces sp. A1-5]